MKVWIAPYPPFWDELGRHPFDLEVPEGAPLRDVLRLLASRASALLPAAEARSDEWLWGRLIVHRHGEMLLLDDLVAEGDTLELLPPIAGGEETAPSP